MKLATPQYFLALVFLTTLLAVIVSSQGSLFIPHTVASPEICNNVTVLRYVLDSECVSFNTSFLSDPLDLCRFDLGSYGCVHDSMSRDYGVNCNETQLAENLRREEVGRGLLAYLNFSYCEANLQDSPCEVEVFMKHSLLGDCLQGFFSLLAFHRMLDPLDDFPSAAGGGKLKCSVFSEMLKCYATSGEFNDTCTVADIAGALRTTTRILVEIADTLPGMIIIGGGDTQFDVDFTECNDELPLETCPSTSAVADSIVARCAGVTIYVITVYGVEPCLMYFSFKECIFEIELPLECPEDHLLSSVREHSTYLANAMNGFDFLQCEYMFCWHDFVEHKKHEQCSYSYSKLSEASGENEKCRHLRTFVDCVRFMALIEDTHCLYFDIDWLVTTEMSLAGIVICEYPDPTLAESFPETVPEICNSSKAHRHLIEYYCLNNMNISALSDPADRCRFEVSLHGCMLEVFNMNGVPCTMDKIEEVAHRPEVRTGLLDFVDADCHDHGLSNDTECMVNFYATVGRLSSQQCHDYLYAFPGLTSLMTPDDVNAIDSSSGQNSLKCSVFEETLMCFMRSENTTNCAADDLALALQRVLHISYQFLLQEFPASGTIQDISYDECLSSLTSQYPTRDCPESSLMADLVVAKCATEVLWQLGATGGHPCSSASLINCLQTVPVPNGDICSEEYLWNATDEYSWYITQNVGVSADLCRGCTAFGSTYQEYVGYSIAGDTCKIRSMSNTSLQDCLDVCTSLERCLSFSFHHDSNLCVAHQCSFVTHPQDWGQWGARPGTNSYVKDCDYDQAIVSCPAGQEYDLVSGSCVDCPVGTYKEGVYGHCILCPVSYKTAGLGATSLYDCDSPYFYCTSVSNCIDPAMSCVNNTCICPPAHYYDFTTDQCVAFDCQAISGGYLKLSDQDLYAEDGCIISLTFGLPAEACLYDCDLDPDCRAVSFNNDYYPWCKLLRCYDLPAKYDMHALLVDSFIKACPQSALECFPNGTIRFPNPYPEVYVDAMAIQDEGLPNATKCDVVAQDEDILITGCSMDSDITLFFSNRTLGDDDLFAGLMSQAHLIRCNKMRPRCYPNGTIWFPNPDPDVFVDAMAIQNQGSQQAIKCLVDPQDVYILINGCSTDFDITVFFSNRSLSDDDVFAGRRSQAHIIRCNDIPDSGVTRIVEDYFGPRLEVTPQAPITPSFIVTSALRSDSVTGEIVATATVGKTIYWTIDIPSEYSGRPTCHAYSGSSSSGDPSAQLILDGCTVDSSLVADQFRETGLSIGQSHRIWTILYAFKFYNADDIFLECTVKVCSSSSDSCDFSCPGSSIGKRMVQERVRHHRDVFFTTGTRLHIVSRGNTINGYNLYVWFTTALLASLCNSL